MKCKLKAAQLKELQALLKNYDVARCALCDRLQEVVDEWNDEWAESSERWQEGDGGQDAQERIYKLQDACNTFAETPELDIE